MNRHEDRFASGRDRYRFNRPYNNSNDYNNRSNYDRNKSQNAPRPTGNDTNVSSDKAVSTSSSNTSQVSAKTTSAQGKTSPSPAKETQVKVEAREVTNSSQDGASNQAPKKTATVSQSNPPSLDVKKKFTGDLYNLNDNSLH